jgi:predicted glycoside hydrolase/deacetylase ChbG (UPF0249 family)
MSNLKHLIVNADDLGLSEGVNRGIFRSHENGIVTSASLMVRQPAAKEAARIARRFPDLAIGLHFDLAEWYRDGETWKTLYQFADREDLKAVRSEFVAQLAAFRQLTGRNPTHLDSHQHTHRSDGPARHVLRRAGRSLGVPVRHFSRTVRYCGDFYALDGDATAVSAHSLLRIIETLTPGVTELCCHPGDDGEMLATRYRSERGLEVEALTNVVVRRAIGEARINLQSFATFPRPQTRRRSPLQRLRLFLNAALDA